MNKKMELECDGMVADPRTTHPESNQPKCKDSNKKKKVNRRAKLKQSKLDVRREQWLSQSRNKIIGQQPQDDNNKREQQAQNLSDHLEEDNNGKSIKENKNNHILIEQEQEQGEGSSTSFSDMDSVKASIEDDETCSSEDTNSKNQMMPDSGQDEEHDDLHDPQSEVDDDWEAAADALVMEHPLVKSHSEEVGKPKSDDDASFTIEKGTLKPEYKIKSANLGNKSSRSSSGGRAWRPDDTGRPNTLPKLSKLNSFPSQSYRSSWGGWNCACGTSAANSTPLSCPICYEDLDTTDSNFAPCECGFRLCLFCHKRIMEQDARCPGCRKRYNPPDNAPKVTIVKLPRSYSMRLKA